MTAVAAIEYFHDLLRREHAATSYEQLTRAIQNGGMVFLDRPICDVLRPLFLDRATYAAAQRAATLVAHGVTALSRRLASDPVLRGALGLTPDEEALIQMDPAEPTEPVGRFDGFVTADGEIRFVEYNPMPAGIVSGDELREVYAQLPIMAAFHERHATHADSTSSRVCDAILRTHQRKGGTGRPNLAFLSQPEDAADLSSASLLHLDEITKLGRIVAEGGFELRVIDPQQLRFERGALFADDFRIDVALVANWPLLASSLDPGAPFYRAVHGGATWVLNSASTAILRGSKSVFAMLSDPAYAGLFEPEVAAALARHVPWTRRVQQGTTTYRDRTVDLVPFLAAHRDQLVLKPADEYGASGVVLGWQCDDAAWAGALDRALARPYVAQERVSIDSQLFPTMIEGELQLEKRFFTLDPFIWNDTEAHGAYIRLSRSAIMNLSAGGGSTTPLLIVDEQAAGHG